MKTQQYKLLDIYETKQNGVDVFVYWSLSDILSEINRDRSERWTDYNETDWRDGWNEWCEGDFYKLVD